MSDTVTSEIRKFGGERSGVVITLNRPGQLNAFNDEQHSAFYQALKSAGDDSAIGAILITGSGRGFCAGQDLGDRDPAKMTGPPDLGQRLTLSIIRLSASSAPFPNL